MNHFHNLELEATLHLDEAIIQDSYQKLAKQHHPDQGGDEATFKAINASYNLLLNLDQRISHLLELEGYTMSGRGAISSEISDLFMPISDLIQSIEQQKKAYAEAHSALQKALLAPQTMELQDRVETLSQSVDELTKKISKKALQMDSKDNSQFPELEKLSRDLTFLRKWKAQLKQAYGSVVSLTF